MADTSKILKNTLLRYRVKERIYGKATDVKTNSSVNYKIYRDVNNLYGNIHNNPIIKLNKYFYLEHVAYDSLTFIL